MNWANPDNWLDLVAYAWYGLVLIAIAAVPSALAVKNHKTLAEVHTEVKNSHASNLRDDLDRAIAAIDAIGHDVRGLRQDLMAEEDRRRRDVAELETRIGRHRKQED